MKTASLALNLENGARTRLSALARLFLPSVGASAGARSLRLQPMAAKERTERKGSGEQMLVISHGKFPVGRRSRGALKYFGLAGAAPYHTGVRLLLFAIFAFLRDLSAGIAQAGCFGRSSTFAKPVALQRGDRAGFGGTPTLVRFTARVFRTFRTFPAHSAPLTLKRAETHASIALRVRQTGFATALLLTMLVGCSLSAGTNAAESFPDYGWAVRAGGSGDDSASAVAFGPNGECYVVGKFQGTATFGTTNLTSGGDYDIFIAAYSRAGQLLWAKVGGENVYGAAGIAVAANGDIYISGSVGNRGGFFVKKFDSVGQAVWVWANGAGVASAAVACAADKNGDVYVTSYIYVGDGHEYDIFVTKISAGKSLLWERQLGGASYFDFPSGIAVDTNLNCFVSGVLGNYPFVAKYDADGNQQWVKQSSANGPGPSVVADNAGGVYFAGSISGSGSFDTNAVSSAGGRDAALGRYDASGASLWVKTFGGTNDDEFHSITRDKDGNLLATGFFQGSMNIAGTSLASQGGKDLLIVKFAPDGTPIAAGQSGGSGDDIGEGISVDSQGLWAVAGSFSVTVAFGSSLLASSGGSDAFVVRFAGRPLITTQPQGQTFNTGDTVNLSVVAIGQEPMSFQWQRNGNPVNGATNTLLTLTNLQIAQSGQYSVVVSNALGATVSSNAEVIINNNGDSNGNGIPNWWEALYGLNSSDPTNATNHPSGDLLTYLLKYRFGHQSTHPRH